MEFAWAPDPLFFCFYKHVNIHVRVHEPTHSAAGTGFSKGHLSIKKKKDILSAERKTHYTECV